jgi:hypothetical protein
MGLYGERVLPRIINVVCAALQSGGASRRRSRTSNVR